MIKESELYNPALDAAKRAGGFITTTDLIDELFRVLAPTGAENEILDGRNDTRFSQKVRNIISHKGSPRNIINRGLALHDKDKGGIEITSKGRDFLDNL